MKLPKSPLFREWQENPETKVFARTLKNTMNTELFQALKRACRSSSDGNVREALAKYEQVEEFIKALEGVSTNDHQSRDDTEQ